MRLKIKEVNPGDQSVTETQISLYADAVGYIAFEDDTSWEIVLTDEYDYVPRHRKPGPVYG